ncbi:MAG: trypsin-like serine protease [Pseudomonadota bacterium]
MRNKLLSRSILSGLLAFGLTSVASAQIVEVSEDEKAVAYTPSFTAARTMTASQVSSAQSRLPMLTSISQLPNIGLLQQSESGFSTQAFGSFGGFPFTTRIVAQRPNSNTNGAPVDAAPYRQTGKLFMDFQGSLFVCSASVIRPGLVLTAAHCVHDFGLGDAGFADEVFFEPARHNDDLPYGTWTVQSIIIPGVYFNGTDRCLPDAPGIVCENDIAILVMDSRMNEDGVEEEIGDVVGRYGLYQNDTGYTALGGDGDLSAHLTELGYPSAGYTGVRMIQNESIAVQDSAFALGPDTDFNQVVIGTNMTGGSSGGPWIHNFGKSDGYEGTPAVDSNRNRVAAVTSWGFVDDSIKIQGASRFGHNAAFPEGGPTNVRTLINFGCSFGPSKC